MENEIKVIDYLIENGGCDLCGKCIYSKPILPNKDVAPCNEFKKHGNTACRNGMIAFFEREKIQKGNNKLLDEFIREIKKFGISKVEKLSGINRNTISSWIRKKYIPTMDNAQKVANAMGLEFLLFEKE